MASEVGRPLAPAWAWGWGQAAVRRHRKGEPGSGGAGTPRRHGPRIPAESTENTSMG